MTNDSNDAPLENNHNVYILGAGFSRAAGFPLMNDFMLQMRNARPQLASENRTAEVNAVDRVLRFALDAASAAYRIPFDPENIEELFSLASSSGDDSLSHAFTIAIASTLAVCHSGPPQHVLVSANGPFIHKLKDAGWSMDPYGKMQIDLYEWILAALLNVPLHDSKPRKPGHDGVRNTLITFNYDILVEQALQSLGVPFDLLVTGERVDATKVIKLHGSIDWVFDDGKLIKRTDLASARGKPVAIVPPTWRKAFLEAFSTLWDEAVRALTTATRVVIIGYSVPRTDQHFKYMLAEGLRRNVSLRRVVVVDPNLGKLEDPLQGLFRREFVEKGYVTGVNLKAENFAGYPTGLQDIARPIHGKYTMQLQPR